MGTKIMSVGLKGLEGYRVKVEVQAMEGINTITIVGLPDASVKESKERITAAFHSLGYRLFHKKVIINLSPPEQKKNGPLFDLPIAIGILISMQDILVDISDDTGFLGALSLDGGVEPVGGMLPAVLAARKLGLRKLYLPYDENIPSIDIKDLQLIYVSSLLDVIKHLSGESIPTIYPLMNSIEEQQNNFSDFHEIIGHQDAKHALEIAAAGGHHLLLSGPPGCGKSMLAESFPSIFPPLTKENWLEVLSIYQLNGMPYVNSMYPPYRNPHHTASGISIVGGGQNPRPGEISLSHHGVLFLDELAEFPKKTLEMLRQPLETGTVTISRVKSTITYPALFTLIGATNTCPCGHHGSTSHYCTCTPKQINAYQNRISGPIQDRFDIHLALHSINMTAKINEVRETSETVRKRVVMAREMQWNRYGIEICNSRVPYEILLRTSPLADNMRQFIKDFSLRNQWSNRREVKVIRLARTIADLNGQKKIDIENIIEASQLNERLSVQ
ncbi:YifB family Mg chelatase-like AAA ATPase [Mesobacillus maritimus]|uniref:YifB family Mg chelatase-like AAA ATPase n=1 Tax=Mesobacillus maritimus TaxID=1643336 RepID=UPI00384AEC3F